MTTAETLAIIRIIELVLEVSAPVAIKAIDELGTDNPTAADFEMLRKKVQAMTLEDFKS